MPNRLYPHTRAQLVAIARQYKPLPSDAYDADADDEQSRVPQDLVDEVVALLADEEEDKLKELLQETYAMDEETVEHSVLDLMHKHRDDDAGVPFLFLTPTRRPISRPSSRASARLRPETPPTSPLGLVFRRPHTPVTSPLAPSSASYMSAKTESKMNGNYAIEI